MSAPYHIRPITPDDNQRIAKIIREVLAEHGAIGDGYAGADAEMADLAGAYAQPRRRYYVIELDGQLAGGGGIGPLEGAEAEVCELKKMYFLAPLRGLGAGRAIIERCLADARQFGFTRCYLETLAHMDRARALYRKFGFKDLAAPLGTTGHSGCNRWMIKQL